MRARRSCARDNAFASGTSASETVPTAAVAVVATALVAAGCNSGPGKAGALETFEDSASYAIGQGLGESITATDRLFANSQT